MRQIKVVPYDASWVNAYRKEKSKLEQIFSKEIVDIYHIGSTSVPNIYAKPIIDILIVVKHIENVDLYNSQMMKLDYIAKGENGLSNRRFFIKGGNHRTHHIHIFPEYEQAEIIRHVAVRDYLLNHPRVVKAYGEFKQQLAVKFPFDSEGYWQGKYNYMKQLESDALQWYKK